MRNLLQKSLRIGIYGGCALASIASANPIALAIGSLGTNLLSPHVDQGWRFVWRRLFGDLAIPGQPIQTALRDSYIEAVAELAKKSPQQSQAAKTIFEILASDAASILDLDRLKQLTNDPESIKLLNDGAAAARDQFNIYLETTIKLADPELQRFIRLNFLKLVATTFNTKVFAPTPDGAVLRDALEQLLQQAMLERLTETENQSAEIKVVLTELKTNFEAWTKKPPAERNAKIIATLDEYEKRVVARLSVAITTDGGKTREHSANQHEQTRTLIREIIAPRSNSSPTPDGTLNRIFSVPHNRNPHFTGRDDLLTQITTAYDGDRRTASLVQAIQGLGGVGKTQLAIEYAYRHEQDYDGVWWIRAEDPTTLAADYAALATRLRLVDPTVSDQQVLIDAARTYLETTENRWLIVFDNATDPITLKPYRPQRGRSDILITSRHRAFRTSSIPVTVDVFAPDAAIAFLCDRTGKHDTVAAGDLAAELGYLPLALEQAAAFVVTTGESLGSYLALYRDNPLSHLTDDPPDGEFDYPATVATTWNISFRAVAELSPAASDLLNLCAFFAPDAIPFDVLRMQSHELPDLLCSALSDPSTAAKTLAIPLKYSLIERTDDHHFSMHRLVQLVTRNQLKCSSKNEYDRWATIAIKVLNLAFLYKKNDVSSWHECARLLSHSLAATDQIRLDGGTAENEIQLLNRVGRYLRRRAQLQSASVAIERALEVAERILPPNHPNIATTLGNLAGLLREQGDLAAARPLYDRALTIKEAAYGLDHPSVAITLSNLAGLLREQGDLAGARPLYDRVLRIKEKAHGLDHPSVAITLSNLAGLLREQGDLAGARPLYDRVLRIKEKAYGLDHPSVAITLSNLALLLKEQGDRAAARPLFDRSLNIKEASYGPDHPSVAITLVNAGSLCLQEGNLTTAQEHFNRAYRIFVTVYGPTHPHVATTRGWLDRVSSAHAE